MPKRSRLSLEDVAAFDNLSLAFARAARGKRRRPEVRAFEADLLGRLERLGMAIRDGTAALGRFQSFRVFDPKPRCIHAPCFEERVLHHALLAKMGPVLEAVLQGDVFACREGKGCLAAVHRAQAFSRRYPIYVKVDVRRYFDSIPHDRLLRRLERRFRDRGLLGLVGRILGSYEVAPGRGLPIGALTSQHFGNLYLEPLDRFLLEELRVGGMVRYMDDLTWWCVDRPSAKSSLAAVLAFVHDRLSLELHPPFIQRSDQGLGFLGYRIEPRRLSPSRRRRKRYLRARWAWERAFRLGLVSPAQLQRGVEGAVAVLQHADAHSFRAADLAARPAVDA